jgi:hypothetical protein
VRCDGEEAREVRAVVRGEGEGEELEVAGTAAAERRSGGEDRTADDAVRRQARRLFTVFRSVISRENRDTTSSTAIETTAAGAGTRNAIGDSA